MQIKKTEMFNLAKGKQEKKLSTQILIFIAVFLIGLMISSIPTIVLMVKDMVVAINSGVPVEEVETTLLNTSTSSRAYLYANLFGTILSSIVVILYCRFFEKRSLRSIGFTHKKIFSNYIIGLLIGFVMFSAVVGINIATGAMKFEGIVANLSGSTIGFILIFLLGFIFQGAHEEILVRGYFMTSLGAHHNIKKAIIVSSIAFAFLHIFNPGISLVALINLVLVAVFWGLYVICFDNLWGACAMHSIWNFVQGNFYGISVSGMNISDTIFTTSSVPGKELINGGAFGAEGGIATTIVIVLSIIILLGYMKKKGKLEKETVK